MFESWLKLRHWLNLMTQTQILTQPKYILSDSYTLLHVKILQSRNMGGGGGGGVRGGTSCHSLQSNLLATSSERQQYFWCVMRYFARNWNTGLPSYPFRARELEGWQWYSLQSNLFATSLESQSDCVILYPVPGWKYAGHHAPLQHFAAPLQHFAAPSLEPLAHGKVCAGM